MGENWNHIGAVLGRGVKGPAFLGDPASTSLLTKLKLFDAVGKADELRAVNIAVNIASRSDLGIRTLNLLICGTMIGGGKTWIVAVFGRLRFLVYVMF